MINKFRHKILRGYINTTHMPALYELLRAFSASMFISIIARILQLLMAALLGRQLGPDGFGVFTVATGVGLLIGEIAAQGWPLLMSRNIPHFVQKKKWADLRGLFVYAARFVTIGSLITSAILYGISQYLFKSNPSYSQGLLLAALLGPVVAFSRLRRQQYAGFHRSTFAIFIDEVSAPLGLVIAAVTIGFATASSSILIYVSAWCVAVVASSLFFRSIWPNELNDTKPSGSFMSWWSTATGGLMATLSRLTMTKVDVLMLAPMVSIYDAGLYSAALRITYVLTFPQVVLMTVLTPRLSLAYYEKNHIALKRIFLMGNMLSITTALPSALFIIFAPIDLMTEVYGQTFQSESPLLLYLTLGQTIVSLSMPYTSLLLMTGREWIVGVLYTIMLIAMIAINYILIPVFGSLGAAYCNLSVSFVLALVQVTLTSRIINGGPK